MHPPPFQTGHQLSDWPGCSLEVRCPCSPAITYLPVRLLIERHGDRTFQSVLDRLRCRTCKGKASPVYLVAGHNRTFQHGGPPDWGVELVPVDRPDSVRATLDNWTPKQRDPDSSLFAKSATSNWTLALYLTV